MELDIFYERLFHPKPEMLFAAHRCVHKSQDIHEVDIPIASLTNTEHA